ncbi:hypothetical protein Q7P37_010794 [Cladosporium fusiforme]
MSATSTPHRHHRDATALSIDTKESDSKTVTALQCAGWLTPPQSAHESRRPSLAYSSYSEMPYSAASTGAAFSLPSTPSRALPEHARHNGQSFTEDHVNLDLSTPFNSNPLNNTHLTQDLVQLNLEAQANCDLNQASLWSNHTDFSVVADNYSNYLDPEQADPVWREQQAPDDSFLQQPHGLQTTLFPISHGLAAGHHILPQTPTYDGTACSMSDSTATVSAFPYNAAQTTCLQSPVLVEPNLLVQCYSGNHHYPTNGSLSSSPQEMSASFDSSMGSSWEEIRTPSPEVDYCQEADGYVMVCDEDHDTSPISTANIKPSRTKLRSRKATRRSRKTTCTQGRIIRGRGVEITLEGESIAFENDQLVRTGQGSHKKPFICGELKEDGTSCRAAFQRSEHLKRHMSSHSSARQYPCVLPDCSKKIGRSDNACDHFRTHLQLDKANKRNKHFQWREVERRIRHAYDEKKSFKILANLQRWLQDRCNVDADLRHAHHDDQYVRDNRPLYREEYDDED